MAYTALSDGRVAPHFEQTCARKKKFASGRLAWFELRQMHREGRNCKTARVYECAICGKWHIGRVEK